MAVPLWLPYVRILTVSVSPGMGGGGQSSVVRLSEVRLCEKIVLVLALLSLTSCPLSTHKPLSVSPICLKNNNTTGRNYDKQTNSGQACVSQRCGPRSSQPRRTSAPAGGVQAAKPCCHCPAHTPAAACGNNTTTCWCEGRHSP